MIGKGFYVHKLSFLANLVFFLIDVPLSNISYNVLALGAVADFGAQNCQYTTKVDAR